MEDTTADDRRKGATKTPKGAGYTTRIDGKKNLTTALLEQQVDQAQANLAKLQQQNRVLRIRETMQLETLEGAEMAIHYMGSLAQEATSSQQIMQCLLPAVVLDMQAIELKQALQPPPQLHLQLPPNCPAVTTQEAHALLASAFATVQAAHAAVAQSGAVSGSSSGSGSSDASETAWSGGPVGPSARRMQRLMATLTPEEVQEARALTLQGVAERVRDCIALLRKARHEMDDEAASGTSADAAPSAVTAAVDNYIRTQMLSLVSDEPRHCQLIGMNLETLQQEVPCDAVWLDVVRAANLRPQQVQHISMALQTASQQQAELLQEQQAIMQQLQALLGASAAAAPAVTSSSVPQSFAAAAAAGDDDGGGGVVSAGCGIEAAGAATQAAAAAAAAAPTALSVAAAAEALPAYAAAPSIVGRTRAGVRKARAAAVDAAGGSSSTGYQQQVKLEPTAAADNPQTASKVSGSNPAADRGGSDACAAADSQASHAGCVIPAAAAAAAAGAVAVSAAGSSGSSVGGMPGGVLAVEDAEQAERLLREWQRVCWSMKRTSRLLAPMMMNLLDFQQLADGTLAAYPYIVPAPKFCAIAVQMMAEKQKQEGKPQTQGQKGHPRVAL